MRHLLFWLSVVIVLLIALWALLHTAEVSWREGVEDGVRARSHVEGARVKIFRALAYNEGYRQGREEAYREGYEAGVEDATPPDEGEGSAAACPTVGE